MAIIGYSLQVFVLVFFEKISFDCLIEDYKRLLDGRLKPIKILEGNLIRQKIMNYIVQINCFQKYYIRP